MTGHLLAKSSATSMESMRSALGKAFWSIASHYGLTQKEQAVLLGIKLNKARLSDHRSLKTIPDDPDKALRVSHLVGIHKNLRILFPNNREVVYRWFKTPRPEFGGASAMDFIEEGGIESLPRLAAVRRLLDSIRVSE